MKSIAIADDHVLLRNGLASHIETLNKYTVLFQADNGADFISRLETRGVPDIALLDINMPVMDGYETASFLNLHHPETQILALSMYESEAAIVRMLASGAKGYVLKDIDPGEFAHALDALSQKRYYYSELVTGKIVHALNAGEDILARRAKLSGLTDREIQFMKLACTEMTYRQIADKMFVSTRTVDNYRDGLFIKLNVQTRIGIVIYAIKNGIFVIA